MEDSHVIVKNEVDGNVNEVAGNMNEVAENMNEVTDLKPPRPAEDIDLFVVNDKDIKVKSYPKVKACGYEAGKNLYPYRRKKLFEAILKKTNNSEDINNVLRKLNVEPEAAMEYFNNVAYNTQIHVHEECGSLSFENISDWLWTFEKYKLNNNCNFEPALIMKAIADNENLPAPAELDGIDLKSIYKFLGNAMLGLPQAELDVRSAMFLSSEFESLIDDANSDLADTEVKYMKQGLEEDVDAPVPNADVLKDIQSLDPLYLDSDILKFF